MQELEIFFIMSNERSDLEKMKQSTFLSKLYMGLAIVIVDLSYIETLNLIMFFLTMKEE